MDPQFDALYACLALARRPGNSGAVDDRTRLMVRQLAAERVPLHRPRAPRLARGGVTGGSSAAPRPS